MREEFFTSNNIFIPWQNELNKNYIKHSLLKIKDSYFK